MNRFRLIAAAAVAAFAVTGAACAPTPGATCADVRDAVAAGESVDYLPSGLWMLHDRQLVVESPQEDACWN